MRHQLSIAVAAAAFAALPAGRAAARAPATVPLEHVLAVAKPYPNLQVEIRLQLVRAGLQRGQVSCTAEPVAPSYVRLAGQKTGPYVCQIGKRRLRVDTLVTYLDASGKRLAPASAASPPRAARLRETGLKWNWF